MGEVQPGETDEDGDMNNIPTIYNDILFRSRLEAKWAKVFDALNWKWEYEPIDLNGYIPDFVLQFYKPIIVEVKPILQIDGFHEFYSKILQSGWNGEALILGATLFKSYDWSEGLIIGKLNDHTEFSNAIFERCRNCGSFSFFHETGGWECRINGCYEGDHYLSISDYHNKIIHDAWKKASNEVQWRKGALYVTETL